MNLNFEDFMRKISLPKRYFDNTFVISEKFKEEMNAFITSVKEYKGEGFKDEQQPQIVKNMADVIKKAEEASKIITEIFEFYERSDLAKAQQLMDSLMDLLDNDIFISLIDDWVHFDYNNSSFSTRFRMGHGNQFFRVRAVEAESSDIQKNADELFHVPLSKRAYTSNERFSLVGFPSLYLATMLPLAWQESGCPKKYYYSEYQYTDFNLIERSFDNEFKFLSLYSPKEIADWGIAFKYNDFETWLEIITRYLKTYPLVLACSFVNHGGKVTYKQEYIIPQMLMQWVQRNNTKVQGISYFTCIDNITNLDGWCAYNVAIPTMPPYDKKMYSKPLRERFTWTTPKFYSMPLFDKKENKDDREFIYNLIVETREVMQNYFLPQKYRDALLNAAKICSNLICLMENQYSIDMQLVLYNLNSLSENIHNIETLKLDCSIETDIKTENVSSSFSEASLNFAIDSFKTVYHKVVGNIKDSKTISQIIRKYNDFCWNDLCPCSKIYVIFFGVANTDEPIKWLAQNHLLYGVMIRPKADLINFLKGIALETNVSIDAFFKCHVENDDWLKDNIDKLQSPLIFRMNDKSIYSTPDTKSIEFICAGFDKKVLSDKLLNE